MSRGRGFGRISNRGGKWIASENQADVKIGEVANQKSPSVVDTDFDVADKQDDNLVEQHGSEFGKLQDMMEE